MFMFSDMDSPQVRFSQGIVTIGYRLILVSQVMQEAMATLWLFHIAENHHLKYS